MTPVEVAGRQRVCQVAHTWIGTKYHHLGRIKGAGVDCGQLIAAVFHEAGLIDNAEIASYPPDWMCHRDEERFRAEVERFAETVERAPVAGDIVLFRWGRSLAHGAIVVGWPLIIHAQIGRGVILSSIAAEAELRKRLSSTTWTLKGWA